jgi:genome maintenance exonuclease 1
MFKHEFLEKIDITRIDTDNGRFYEIETGERFKSVTSILGEHGKESLEKWRKRVGEEQANKISTQARIRGSAVHNICEKYLLNDSKYKHKAMPFNLSEFNKIKSILDNNIDTIYGIEHMMYSRKYKCAGTSDLICKWKNNTAIVDFKTSKKVKTEDMITNYFIQTSVYANMVKEIYNIEVPDIVIIMMVDHEDPLIFHKKSIDYHDQLETIFNTG